MDNIYSAPNANLARPNSVNLDADAETLAPLVSTSGWAKYLGVLMFIYFGVVSVGGLIGMFRYSFSSYYSFGAYFLVFSVITITTLALYFFYALNLMKFGRGAKTLRFTRSTEVLESTLDTQYKVWMLKGLILIVALVASLVLPFIYVLISQIR